MATTATLSDRGRRGLLALSAAALIAGVLIATTGGATIGVGPVLLRAHRPWTAVAAGIAAALAALLMGRTAAVERDLEQAWRSGRRRWAIPAIGAAMLAAVVGLVWGTWAASGADASGYVSQAALWVSGRVSVPTPLALGAPWPGPEWTFAPLGWRPAPAPAAVVPTYAPGLPMLMAVFALLGGEMAVFWVVPLTGALAVWWTWRLGLVLSRPRSAAAASVMMACGPAFLFQLVQPMSDVPVTAWWTGALYFVLARRPAIAGLCASAAVLTRPNLAPLAAWLAAAVAFMPGAGGARTAAMRERAVSVASFLAATLPGVAVWMTVNHVWYGHVLSSGYGSFSELFTVANVAPNALRYGRWLWDTHTPFLLLAAASPLVIWWTSRTTARAAATGAGHAGGDTAGGRDGRATWPETAVAFGFAALVLCAYLPYAVFEEWTYLRFLLPAVPVWLVLSCDVADRILERQRAAVAVPVFVLGLASLAGWQMAAAQRGQAFALQRLEQRYVETARQALSLTSSSAVYLAVQHSGSLRHYTGRPILRWDLIEPASFDRALLFLRSHGLTPILVLEDWEETQFRTHLASATRSGALDWAPLVELRLAAKVRFYEFPQSDGQAAIPPSPSALRIR